MLRKGTSTLLRQFSLLGEENFFRVYSASAQPHKDLDLHVQVSHEHLAHEKVSDPDEIGRRREKKENPLVKDLLRTHDTLSTMLFVRLLDPSYVSHSILWATLRGG